MTDPHQGFHYESRFFPTLCPYSFDPGGTSGRRELSHPFDVGKDGLSKMPAQDLVNWPVRVQEILRIQAIPKLHFLSTWCEANNRVVVLKN